MGFSHLLIFAELTKFNDSKILYTPEILVTHVSGNESYVNVWLKVF